MHTIKTFALHFAFSLAVISTAAAVALGADAAGINGWQAAVALLPKLLVIALPVSVVLSLPSVLVTRWPNLFTRAVAPGASKAD